MAEHGPQPAVDPPRSTLQERAPLRAVTHTADRLNATIRRRAASMKEGYHEFWEERREKRAERRERWRQFKEDYQEGGGIKEGLRQGAYWGAFAATTGLLGGGVGGGVLDGLIYSLDHSGPVGSQPLFDTTTISENPFDNPYTAIPVVLAGISALSLGGIAFYRGLTSPAREVRRLRENPWDHY